MNDYARRQRQPKQVLGLALVIAFHLVLLGVIQAGLARQFVKVIKGPVETELLEEKKPDIPPPPPPPPPKDLPPPPPPAYVPPVDTPVNSAPAANAIAAVSTVPTPAPAAPVPVAAPAPVPVAPAAPVHTPAVINAAQSCEKPQYPAASRRAEEEGTVVLKFLIGVDGKVVDSQVEASSGSRRLDEAARAAMAKCQFKPATTDGKPEQSWASIRYTWRLE